MKQCKRCNGYFEPKEDSPNLNYCACCHSVMDILNDVPQCTNIESKDNNSSILMIDLDKTDEIVFDKGNHDDFSIKITLDQNDAIGKEIYDALEAWFEEKNIEDEKEDNSV